MLKWHILIFQLLCLVPLSAQTTGISEQSISFSKAREIILAHNHGLKSAATQTDAAKAGILQAGALPNPSVAVALDNFGSNTVEVSVEQTIELGGKVRSRKAVAQSEHSAAEINRAIAQHELESEIIRRFIPITIISRKLVLLDSIILITETTRAQIQRRVEAGAARKADLVRAEIDLEQRTLERSGLMREMVQTRHTFAALGNGQDTILLFVRGDLIANAVSPSLDELLAAVKNTPQLKAVEVHQASLAAQKKQLQAEVAPDLNISAGYQRDNAAGSNAALVGASITVPLFNSNTHAQQQVDLMRQATGQQRDNSLRLLEAEIRDLHSKVMESERRITVLRTSSIPKTESVLSMMQEYYNAGSAGFLDLAASQSEMLNLKMSLLDMETERALMLADLMQKTSLTIQIVN